MKIAIAHDFLNYLGGAERVSKEITLIFPKATLFTLFTNRKMTNFFSKSVIRVSFVNWLTKFFPRKWLLPLYPVAIESLDFRDFDLVISSTSAFAKGIVVKPKTVHVCYCHTPTRYLWDFKEEYLNDHLKNSSFLQKFLLRLVLNYLRIWDQEAAERPDMFIANSKYTAERIKKYYRREAKVVYPPVNLDKFTLSEKKGDYFLIVSRLSAYKKIDLVVEAFNRLGWPLVVAGTGEEEKDLRKKALPNIRFLGFVKDKDLPELYAGCRAFIFPGEDDFGLTIVEAMASGKPVLAYGRGGALEIIENEKTGLFYDSPEVEILIDGLRRLKEKEGNFKKEYIRERALNFSRENFRSNFINTVFEALTQKK